MLWQVLFITIVIKILWYRWKIRRWIKSGKQFKNDIISLPIIGHGYQFMGSNEGRFSAICQHGREALKHDGVTVSWLGYNMYVLFAEPLLAEWALRTCLEKSDEFRLSRSLLGEALPLASVSLWRERRKVFTRNFSPRNLTHFVEIFVRQGAVWTDQLLTLARDGPFQLWRYIMRYAMDSLLETSLGLQSPTTQRANHPLLVALRPVGPLLGARMTQPWLHCDRIYELTPAYKEFTKHKRIVYTILEEMVQTKEEELRKRQTEVSVKILLETLLKAENGVTFTKEEIEGEILSVFIAGVDTSATAIGFTLNLLARHQDIQDKVFKEIKEVFGDSDRPVTSEDLPQLKYLEATIKESMRLYPPASIIARKVHEDMTTPTGLHLLKDTVIIIHVWALHRNQQYWGADAEEFRPERFLETPLVHPAQFMSFSYGPRNCVGSLYAMMSMKTALATFLRRCKVLPVDIHNEKYGSVKPLRVKFDVVIKDVDRVRLQIENRNKN